MARAHMTEAGQRRWLEREQRRHARERLAAARRAVKERRAQVRELLAELRQSCRARRLELRERRKVEALELRERYRVARAELRDAQARARRELAGSCASGRAELRASVAEARRRAFEAGRELAWFRKGASASRDGMTAAERLAHAIDAAKHDTRSAAEAELLERLARRRVIAASSRMTLSEAFAQYLHDHPEELAELERARELEWLAEAEAEERAAYEASRPRRRRRAPVVAEGAELGW